MKDFVQKHGFPILVSLFVIGLYFTLINSSISAGSKWQPSDLIALLTALLTFWYVYYTAKMVQSLQKNIEYEYRANIIIRTDYKAATDTIKVILENIGRSPARDIQFRSDPKIPSFLDGRPESIPSYIKYLAPNQRFETEIGFKEQLDERRDLSNVNVKVNYDWGKTGKGSLDEVVDLTFIHVGVRINPSGGQKK